MNALFFLAPLAAVILLMLPLVSVYRGTVTKKKAKHAVLFNLCGFFGVCLISVLLPVGGLCPLPTRRQPPPLTRAWPILAPPW